MFSVDGFLWKLILVNKLGSVTSGLKKHSAHAHLNRYVGPYIMYIEDMLWSFDRASGFAQFTKNRTEHHLCTKSKFYAHAQQLKNEED